MIASGRATSSASMVAAMPDGALRVLRAAGIAGAPLPGEPSEPTPGAGPRAAAAYDPAHADVDRKRHPGPDRAHDRRDRRVEMVLSALDEGADRLGVGHIGLQRHGAAVGHVDQRLGA